MREAGVPAARRARPLRRRGRWRPRRRCRSRSGRPWCSWRRSGSARRRRPSADARGWPAAARGCPSVSIARPICRRRAGDDRRRGRRSRPLARRARGRSASNSAPPRVPASTTKRCSPPSSEFGQRQVEAGLGLRAGAHRDAETGAAGLAAIDRDDEGAVRGGPR